MIILFLGPDGVGKTTIANAVAKQLNYEYYYGGARNPATWLLKMRQKELGTMEAKKKHESLNAPIKKESKITFTQKLKKYLSLALLIYDGYVKLNKLSKSKKNYVLDRSVIDVFVQNEEMWNMPFRKTLIRVLTKNISNIFLLYVEPKIVFERKQELSIDEITIQLNKFKEIVELKGGQIVDNSNSIDKTLKSIINE